MKKINSILKKYISNSKRHIEKLGPDVSHIDINFENVSPGRYRSRIEVFIKGKGKFVAKKLDESIPRSLYKATQAIMSQIKKVKGIKNRKISIRKDLLLQT